jgi:hypothetical protein
MSINVQFTDSDKKVICGYLSEHQDDDSAYPNQGEVDVTDERWLEYYNSVPTSFQWIKRKVAVMAML